MNGHRRHQILSPAFKTSQQMLAYKCPMTTFRQQILPLFTHEFWTLLVTETNRMADQLYQARPELGNRSIFHGWEPVNVPEMKKFIGIILLSGLVYKSAMRSFWTPDPLTSTPAFSALMKRDRFEQIMKFFNFNNNADEPPHTANERDRLYKIRPLLEQLSTSFRNAFTPEKEICIDESLMLYKGRVIFRQYMPLIRARFGIKIFCLTDKNGYLHSFSVYTGTQDPLYNVDSLVPEDAVNLSLTAKTTLALIGPFLDKGYHLYINNRYTSVPLTEYLHQSRTAITGTAHCDRVDPQGSKTLAGRQRTDFMPV
ncbi:PiggyBac transposable element-derived protein 4 [Elysia marginata]|uniref:PiggyBac transposable element-derived protein 4 n=1 Tax=Elysia marginata TaxID=1093978 RepID=A0AAV4G681_9GAST|nr:PiggyBac transposable element-derived protein 4 [Elysia marginata]